MPFDAIDKHALGTGGEAGGAIGARDIGPVAFVDHARAGHPLIRLEAERSAADDVRDLLERIGGGDAFRHDRADVGAGLAEG